MGKAIQSTDLSSTLNLSECKDGYWLYDETRGMNLAMRSKTPTDAFVEALTYYQNRLSTVESELSSLRSKVDAFVSQVTNNED